MLVYAILPVVNQAAVAVLTSSPLISVQLMKVSYVGAFLNETNQRFQRLPDAVGIVDPGRIEDVRQSKTAFFRILDVIRSTWRNPVPIYAPQLDQLKRLVTGDAKITEAKLLDFVHKHGQAQINEYVQGIAACMAWYVQGALKRGDAPDIM